MLFVGSHCLAENLPSNLCDRDFLRGRCNKREGGEEAAGGGGGGG